MFTLHRARTLALAALLATTLAIGLAQAFVPDTTPLSAGYWDTDTITPTNPVTAGYWDTRRR